MVKTDIKSIIKKFSEYGFDDFNFSKQYKIELYKKWKQDDNLSDQDILKIIKDELLILSKFIKDNMEKEFICLPESFDYKYGHWNSFQWIIGRWYMEAKTIKDVPEWYRNIISITNKKEYKRQVIDLIDQILNIKSFT